MATLKISDISVGDWVGYNGKSYRTVIVDALDQTATIFGNDEQGDIHIDQLAPIPITAEILEKNGWGMRTFGHSTCECNGTYVGVVNTTRDYGVSVIDDDGIRMGVDYLLYVHQLQHALRLAGVEKEINL